MIQSAVVLLSTFGFLATSSQSVLWNFSRWWKPIFWAQDTRSNLRCLINVFRLVVWPCVCVLTVGGYEPSQLMRYQTSHPIASTLPENMHPPWPLLPRSPSSARRNVQRRQVGQLGRQKSTSVKDYARAIFSQCSGCSELLWRAQPRTHPSPSCTARLCS